MRSLLRKKLSKEVIHCLLFNVFFGYSSLMLILFYFIAFLCVFAILIYKVVSYFIKLELGKGIPLNYVTQNIVHIKTHIFKLINMKKDISDNKNPE